MTAVAAVASALVSLDAAEWLLQALLQSAPGQLCEVL